MHNTVSQTFPFQVLHGCNGSISTLTTLENFPWQPLRDWVVPSFITPHDPLLYYFLLLVIQTHYRTHQTTPPNLVVLVIVLINWNICAYIFPGQWWPCTASLRSGLLGRLWPLCGGHWEGPSTSPWYRGASRHVWGSWGSPSPLWRIHLKLEISLPSLLAAEDPQDCDVICLHQVSDVHPPAVTWQWLYCVMGGSPRTSDLSFTNSLATSSLVRWLRILSTVQPVSSMWHRLPRKSHVAHEPWGEQEVFSKEGKGLGTHSNEIVNLCLGKKISIDLMKWLVKGNMIRDKWKHWSHLGKYFLVGFKQKEDWILSRWSLRTNY